MFLKFSARRHVKALAPSKFPSFSAAFCVPECLRVCFTHSLPFQVCAFAYNIPSVCVCVCVFITDSVVFSCKGPPPLSHSEGNSVPCVCGFQGAFKENKAQRPHSPHHHHSPKTPSSSTSPPPSSPSRFFPPHSLHEALLYGFSYRVTELISYAACNREKSTIMANILL